MKITLTILLCLIGCAHHVPDCDRITDLQFMLASPIAERAVPDPTLQDRTANLLDLKQGAEDATDAEIQLSDFRVIDYFRSSPPCPPCVRQAAESKHVKCKVDTWNTTTKPLGWIAAVPTIRLLRYDRDKAEWIDLKVWRGFTSADDINAEIDRQTKAVESQAITVSLPNEQLTIRRSESDLRSWISEHYSQSTPLRRATVNPRSWVWTHLRNDHGFTGNQVNALPQWMALALHDAVHPRSNPLITPWGMAP